MSKAQGKGRFGKGRVPGCKCETNYTCGPCLRGRKPYFYTLSDGSAITVGPFQGNRAYDAACAAMKED